MLTTRTVLQSIENCYFANNTTANIRVSDDAIIRNSVSIKDKQGPGKPLHNQSGEYSDICRGLWVRDGGPARAINCQFSHTYENDPAISIDTDASDAGAVIEGGNLVGPIDGEGRVDLSNVGNDPDPSPPAGVPMTPMEAITGTSSASGPGAGTGTGTGTQLPRELVVTGGEQEANYTITVSGDAQRETSS